MTDLRLARVAGGRTDLILDLLAAGVPAWHTDADGVPLLNHCAYFGDVSAMRVLLEWGASPRSLGVNLGLHAAAFHGHWQLCEYLLELGADASHALAETGETPLHAALCTTDRTTRDVVLSVLLRHGADPTRCTVPGVPTDAFMRDGRTRGETALHRAAAFGTEATIRLLLDAGADVAARDANGDSPLAWASWYTRPDGVLRLLCFEPHSIPAHRRSMQEHLVGGPDYASAQP